MGLDNWVSFHLSMQKVARSLTDEKLKAGMWLVLDFVRECLSNPSVVLPTAVDQISDGGQCSICSGPITSWRGDTSQPSPIHQPPDYIYYACCPCSFGAGNSGGDAENKRREAASNKFRDEALSDNPEVDVLQRRLKEEHQKQVDDLNSKLAGSATRELEAKRRIQILQGEVDNLSAERANLYSEIDNLYDELENQAEDPLKQSEVIIPVKIKIRAEH